MSSDLRTEGTTDRPAIDFCKEKGTLVLKGRSLPEDAFTFYKPVIEWLGTYSASPSVQTTLIVDLEYFNTASAKQIFKIITIVNELSKTSKVLIRWHYDKGDRDMLSSGQRFSKLCGLEFEYVQND